MTVSTRLEVPDDEPFLRRLIVETLAEQLMAAAWPEAIRESLLEMQYRARRNSIRDNFVGGESLVVEVDGQNAGWLFVSTRPDEMRLVEIMVLPEYRRQGIGSKLIRELFSKADSVRVPLRLSVDTMNESAVRLYLGLGFLRVGGDEVRHFMEMSPVSRGRES